MPSVVVDAAIIAVSIVALWTGHRLSRPEGGVLVGSEVVRWLSSIL
ncbi:hypothetical protein [Haloprofundus marisrubri]|nr:hypothetical protein [Haloprofundus marisrubri]